MLTPPDDDGRGLVAVLPLALGTVVDRTPGVELFQIVLATPTGGKYRTVIPLPAP